MQNARTAHFAMMLALALPAGCHKSSEGPAVGRVVPFTPPPDPDPAALPAPVADGGALILAGNEQAQLVWTPPAPGPMTALSQCTRWVTGCVSLPDRTLDDCARSGPVCATNQPWNEPACCPASCFARYAAARQAGGKDGDAFVAANFAHHLRAQPDGEQYQRRVDAAAAMAALATGRRPYDYDGEMTLGRLLLHSFSDEFSGARSWSDGLGLEF